MKKRIRKLINDRRQQLQLDREQLKKAKMLSDRQSKKIDTELEELRTLEIELKTTFMK